MVKFGVCEWCLPVNGASAVEVAGKAGFKGIQLSDLGGESQGFPMNNPYVQESYLKASADYDVELQCLHPYGLQRDGTMLFPLDSTKGESAQRSIERCIDACVDMHIPTLMLSSFFDTLIHNRWEFQVYASHLRRAVEMGKDKGVIISYESILSPEQIFEMFDITGP
ncbi:MAG: sugar phosphate isomerase/epimerase, partial [Bacteroides thetaiotaomicron]|nr:sugar phosphate isomerase/epimerase [Bacteroides thetaiotaomicron]